MTRIIQLSQLDAAPELRALVSGGAVSIGNFDGVHRGHASLLQQTHRLAGQVDGPAVAVILDPHPAEILRPDRAPPRLTWVERRAELMTQHGIDALIVCETTPAFLKRTAAEFFETLVVATLNAAAMVEGPNFFFGRDRGGNVDVLTGLCEQRGIKLHVVQPSEADSQIISSTRIRQVLQRGAVAEATDLLGCPYRIRGTVERGAGRGKKIGFPTANLEQIDVLVPGLGGLCGGRSNRRQLVPRRDSYWPEPNISRTTNTSKSKSMYWILTETCMAICFCLTLSAASVTLLDSIRPTSSLLS